MWPNFKDQRVSNILISSWERPLSSVTDFLKEKSIVWFKVIDTWSKHTFISLHLFQGYRLSVYLCIMSLCPSPVVADQMYRFQAHYIPSLLKYVHWNKLVFSKSCPPWAEHWVEFIFWSPGISVIFFCPFLDVPSCFVTLHVAQHLFGSTACPIFYFTEVKQQHWPAEETPCIVFVRRVKAGREATLATLWRKVDVFLEYYR